MKTAVIIEDEPNARALLHHYVVKYCELSIAGEAENVGNGVRLILEKKPDLVFLDISLPDHSGFELIKRLHPVGFEIIFVTAYDQYALQAIRMSAVDYLLKPVDISELRQAVQRAKERIEYKRYNENLKVLLENLKQSEIKRIAIPDGNSFQYEDTANIIRLQARGRYTEIFTSNNKKYTVTRNLGEFDKLLSQYKFLRVHHSHLINPVHILSFEKRDGGFLIMKDRSSVEVSRRNRETLMDFLRNIH